MRSLSQLRNDKYIMIKAFLFKSIGIIQKTIPLNKLHLDHSFYGLHSLHSDGASLTASVWIPDHLIKRLCACKLMIPIKWCGYLSFMLNDLKGVHALIPEKNL